MGDWCSNVELHRQYSHSKDQIVVAMQLGTYKTGELQILSEMKNELEETRQSLKKRFKYEPNALTKEEIVALKLTENQKIIALKRLENKPYNLIAKEIGIRTNDVFKSYQSVLKKAELSKRRKNDLGLSQKELEVLNLLMQGKGRKKIASILNISTSSVKVYIKRIKAKGGDKLVAND